LTVIPFTASSRWEKPGNNGSGVEAGFMLRLQAGRLFSVDAGRCNNTRLPPGQTCVV